MSLISLPDTPLLIMYNDITNELGLSAEGYDLVATVTFTVFARMLPEPDEYEESYSDEQGWYMTDFVLRPERIGYSAGDTVMVEKNSDWVVVGTF